MKDYPCIRYFLGMRIENDRFINFGGRKFKGSQKTKCEIEILW